MDIYQKKVGNNTAEELDKFKKLSKKVLYFNLVVTKLLTIS